MKGLMIVLTVSLMLLAACTDHITNNYYGTETGTIAGRVSPIDPETAVSTSCGTYQTIVDDNGYFLLNELQPGIYRIVLTPADYSRREIDGVVVNPGITKDLGQIILSTFPYPIYQTKPADGDESVYSRTYISLYTDEALNLEDLTAGTSITPPVEGSWQELSSGLYTFILMNRGQFHPGTIYQVTIDASVKTAAGVPLGSAVSLSFQTEQSAALLTATIELPDEGVFGGVPIWDFQPRIAFNEYVSLDSLTRAVSFNPTIEGIWVLDDYRVYAGNRARRFRFFPTTPPLSPETTYALIISDQIALDDSLYLPEPDTTFFTTEPYGVTSVYPVNGYTGMSPTAPVSLILNIEMDTASVEAAFTLMEIDGNAVYGVFDWETNHRRMEFWPDESLHSGNVYKITLSTDARTAFGENLSTAFESYFSVR